jgi:hypothetical protein
MDAQTNEAIASDNESIAAMLRKIAELLRAQGANHFRVLAYEHAAQTVESLDEPVAEILARGGVEALIELPAIGRGLAATIDELVRRGRSTQMDRLMGATDPEALLQTVPGIGPALAKSIHESLHVDSLEGLEAAAHDGRLAGLPGMGERRVAGIRANVASVLARKRPIAPPELLEPSVEVLLAIDRDYLEGAATGKLPKIAPRRFNPRHEAWLPVLHAERDGWHFTALFSNTARAHQLGRTNDWVVIYFYDGDHREAQHTVVTETHGPLAGRRVVRGREADCVMHYEARE